MANMLLHQDDGKPAQVHTTLAVEDAHGRATSSSGNIGKEAYDKIEKDYRYAATLIMNTFPTK